MSSKCTRATPANRPRSRSRYTRRQRREIAANFAEVRRNIEAYEEIYGEWDRASDEAESRDTCGRCGGDGSVEYDDAPDAWGEDSPSEVNHLIECPDCDGTGVCV